MSTKARTHFAGFRKTLVELGGETKAINQFKKLRTSVKLSSAALETAREKSRALLLQIKQTAKPTKKMRNEYDRARSSVERLTQRHALSRARSSMTTYQRPNPR